jgi:rubrerythrin
MAVKKKMTKTFLENAYNGESQAHMKYLLYSEVALKEGLHHIAKLFKAIAFAEQIHARNNLRALEKVKTTAENLQMALEGELFEIEEMYPVYHNAAIFQEENEAERLTHYALEAEKIHANLYSRAKNLAEQGKDLDIDKLFVCPICGHTAEDTAPDYCPVCSAPGDSFQVF